MVKVSDKGRLGCNGIRIRSLVEVVFGLELIVVGGGRGVPQEGRRFDAVLFDRRRLRRVGVAKLRRHRLNSLMTEFKVLFGLERIFCIKFCYLNGQYKIVNTHKILDD